MITVNAMGDKCPIPVVKTKKVLEAVQGAETIEVLVDNETAVQNVSKLAKSSGEAVTVEKLSSEEYKIIIRTGEAVVETSEDCIIEEKKQKGRTIAVISSDRMGEGNEELGHVLMKGFLFALTQLDELPEKMLFYNGGAKLTSEGSESLEDLYVLEKQGVEIMTCGTCLDYYGLKEKLKVGTVTNMYSIVETMNTADRVIRP